MSLITEDILYIFNALKPYKSRLVGGIVRDYLHSKTISEDVDIATQATPETSTKLLEKAGLKVIPTGLKHGTITAVYKNKPYEITTLRKDVNTNGRHAHVEFTSDFKEDAQRRDFTFNALYMDETGHIHDYFNGQADLQEKNVRFIGTATERIEEDYLRILRYFRFHGKFKTAPQFKAETLNIIEQHAASLSNLSRERITAEMVKILNGHHVAEILNAMQQTNCLKHIGLNKPNLTAFEKLNTFEETSTWVKLVCLYPNINPSNSMFKISNREKQSIKKIQKAILDVQPKKDLRTQAYKLSKEAVLQALHIQFAHSGDEAFMQAYNKLKPLSTPVFEVQGKDLIQCGERAGPALGQHLRDIENWWIENKFPNKEACLQHFVCHIQKNCR